MRECVGGGPALEWSLGYRGIDMNTGTATLDAPMAKKKAEGNEPPTKAVKIDRALAGKAQMIATDRGVDLANYISEVLRGVVERDWAKMVRKAGEKGE